MPAAPLPREILPVLQRAWRDPFTTKSDFARQEAPLVALCASERLLTSKTFNPEEPWGSCWRITARGLSLLERNTP